MPRFLARDRKTNPFFRWDLPNPQRRFWHELTPAQLFITSFLLLIFLGTAGFKLLPGLYADPAKELSLLDALFTATSAVCITGLIIVDTATYFTFAGQLYLLILIQLGGLSMIALTSLVIIAIGNRLSLRHESLMLGNADSTTVVNRRRLIRDIAMFTFIIEGLGAVCLYPFFIPHHGWRDAIWHAIFHSISAFCNAGFSTFSTSLMDYQSHPAVQVIIMILIVLGSLGFLTLEELYSYRENRKVKERFRLSLHSRIVISTSAILIVLPIPLFAFFEWSNAFKDLSWWSGILNATFLSVTTRSGGFNTIDYAAATESTNFLSILLMTIGGSPGSTAGGLKTTTIALMALLAWSRFRGREVVSVGARSVREETIQRAVGIFVVSFGMVTAAIFVITATERSVPTPNPDIFLAHMFETVSAFNTVGLSMGVTPNLTPMGKLTTVCLMFLGRVGPLTLAAALAKRQATPAGEFRYAYEEVVVG
jgi:trk system potassium uptake protein TrkH